MHKLILIPLIVVGVIFTEGIFREKIYKPVDEKGTVNFSDSANSPVITTRRGAARQDGAEVLKRNEMANRPYQQIYKSVDETNFSDRPTSSVIAAKTGDAKPDGEEVLKGNEVASGRPMTDAEIKAKLLTMPTWRGSASSSGKGSSGTRRS